jgi:hypothetical protein
MLQNGTAIAHDLTGHDTHAHDFPWGRFNRQCSFLPGPRPSVTIPATTAGRRKVDVPDWKTIEGDQQRVFPDEPEGAWYIKFKLNILNKMETTACERTCGVLGASSPGRSADPVWRTATVSPARFTAEPGKTAFADKRTVPESKLGWRWRCESTRAGTDEKIMWRSWDAVGGEG